MWRCVRCASWPERRSEPLHPSGLLARKRCHRGGFWQDARRKRSEADDLESRMKKVLMGAVLATILASPAWAALDIGDKAPDFSAPAALDGKEFKFSLAESLAKGPVVLYFFPAAFTAGCSAEAHEFAEAIDKFGALGATVIGVSTDDIATQVKFSTQACQGKFPVASDAAKTVIKSYDAAMMIM